MITRRLVSSLAVLAFVSCATTPKYRDPNMDFGVVKTVAVMPFTNLSRDNAAADRVRDVFSNMLLATGAVYVLPHGEVLKAAARTGVASPSLPSAEDVVKLGKELKAEAVITGVVKEYGEVRSGSSAGNVISVSLQLYETTSGKVVWSASSTRGGIGFWDRLLGGGGVPMNQVTEEAVHELLGKLFN